MHVSKCACVLPVRPEPGDGVAAGSGVAGEAGCEGRGPERSLQGPHQGSEAPGPPTLKAG